MGLPDEEAAEEGGEAVKIDIAEEVNEVKNAAVGASIAIADSETGRIEKFDVLRNYLLEIHYFSYF